MIGLNAGLQVYACMLIGLICVTCIKFAGELVLCNRFAITTFLAESYLCITFVIGLIFSRGFSRFVVWTAPGTFPFRARCGI